MVNLRTVSTRRWLRWTKVHIISVTARTVASKAVNPMASRERPTYMQRPCINCGVMHDGESAWHQRFEGCDFFNYTHFARLATRRLYMQNVPHYPSLRPRCTGWRDEMSGLHCCSRSNGEHSVGSCTTNNGPEHSCNPTIYIPRFHHCHKLFFDVGFSHKHFMLLSCSDFHAELYIHDHV